MDRIYKAWKSEEAELPAFGDAEKFEGYLFDIYVGNMGVGVTPRAYDPDCAKHFAETLSARTDVVSSMMWDRSYSVPQTNLTQEQLLPVNMFCLGFLHEDDILMIKRGDSPRIYFDKTHMGELNKIVANLRGLQSLVDVFTDNPEVNSFPMRFDVGDKSLPLLVYSPHIFNLGGCKMTGKYKVRDSTI